MADQFSIRGRKIWVAGHTGLVGSALVRRLESEDCTIVTIPRDKLDLRSQLDVQKWMVKESPDVVILAAARVGGIGANSEYPADFIADNLTIAGNVITQAAKQKVEKLVFLGSSCIYPKFAPQPIREESLLEGQLELTNEPYAIAKIAGLKLCQFYRRQYGHDFISLMPCSLYGSGDRWYAPGAHVIPSLIERIHQAHVGNTAQVTIWGTGAPLREFLFVDDLADAVVHLVRNYSEELHINVGSGEEVSIADLARLIASVVGYRGMLLFDPQKPDGTPRKIMDCSRLRQTGWVHKTSLEQGLKLAYQDFLGASSSRQISSMNA